MPDHVFLERRKTTGPVLASGIHLELLNEITNAAATLIRAVELERLGIYDDLGGTFWINSDSVLHWAKRIVALVEQSRGEMRDGAPQ